MDSGTNKGKKNKSSRTRRTWTTMEEQVLLADLKELVAKGWKCDNGSFRPGYISLLEKKMAAAFPVTDLKGYPHIDSKLKTWKHHYNTLYSMLWTSGFGFNKTDMVIEVESNEVLEEYKKKDHDADGM